MQAVQMTTSPTSSNLARRDELEAEYLRRLFARDAVVWRDRMAARDCIVSWSEVKRVNPTYASEQPRESVSPFEDSYSIGRRS
jgi:hypothetical protein